MFYLILIINICSAGYLFIRLFSYPDSQSAWKYKLLSFARHPENGTKTRIYYKIRSRFVKLLLTGYGYLSLSNKKYHYYLQDHQGNNRVLVNSSGKVEETNHYYPFGGVFASTGNVQPYKYNGKELDAKKGLNWYDYGSEGVISCP